MALPNFPTLQEPPRKTIDYVVFTFDDPLNMNRPTEQELGARPVSMHGAEVADFTNNDYVLFRARLDEVEASRGPYKKQEEKGIKLGNGESGMQLKYRRIKTIDVTCIHIKTPFIARHS